MRPRSALILCLFTAVTICHAAHQPRKPKPSVAVGPIVTSTRVVKPFSSLQVYGHMDIRLHTNCSQSQVVLKGHVPDIQQILFASNQQTLSLSLGAGYPKFGRVTLDICTRYLSAFTYKGSGVIVGNNLNSAGLTLIINNPGSTRLKGTLFLRQLTVTGDGPIDISGIKTETLRIKTKGSPRIKLNGVIHLSQLDMTGAGYLSLYWVKSDWLTLRANGQSFIQLAGIANVLEAELFDQARLGASFLRTKIAFVKTHDHAIAEISTLNKQHTLATGASDIYFYKMPQMRTDFMAYNGAVLDLRPWDAYARHEDDMYNR